MIPSNKIVGPNSIAVEVDNVKEVSFDYKPIYESISRIYLSFINREDVVQSIVNDESNFNIKLFYRLYELIAEHSLYTVMERKHFAQLIENLEKQIKEKIKMDKEKLKEYVKLLE